MKLAFAITIGLLACTAAGASGSDTAPNPIYGAWKFDPARSVQTDDAGSAAPDSVTRPPNSGGRHGGGHGMGGAGRGGAGMGRGKSGSGDAPTSRHASPADLGAQDERGLSRVRATRLTISAQGQRIRFDDGEHAVDLERDGMNLSGAGVGGTLALSAVEPDLVVDSLTDAGTTLSERYHLVDDGQHLELHVRIEPSAGERAREYVRVFDRSEETPAAK